MDAKTIWLFIFVALYWFYCIFWGVKGAWSTKTATNYMIADRGIGVWVFVLAATAASFSGWTFLGHPGLIYRDGLQYAYASFYTITIPFTGVLFLKRQWLLGRHYGFVTPGEMLAAYFNSDAARLLTVLVALTFSIPYIAIQLRASGFLFNVLTNGLLPAEVGMWLLAVIVVLYVALGGLRAVAYIDAMQTILLATGIMIIGIITVALVPDLKAGLTTLTQIGPDGKALFGKTTPDGYSQYIAVPGVIQFVSDGPGAEGGAWTGIMILTYMFALMGIQSAPAFSMWAFANKSPRSFPLQQVWASSFGVGLILFSFIIFQGLGAHFLGADLRLYQSHPELVNPVMAKGLLASHNPELSTEQMALNLTKGKELIQEGNCIGNEACKLVDLMSTSAKQDNLVPQLIYLLGDSMPWLVGLLSVCALAAMQTTGAGYLSTASSMITRDLLRRFIMPNATDAQQKLWGQLIVIGIGFAALAVAITTTDALVLLGGLAVAYGLQMWPALIAVCWWPFLTRQGVVVGLIAGLVAVTLTDSIGSQLIGAWGRWPLTIHSAGWGILFNLSSALLVSTLTQDPEERAHRMSFHNSLSKYAALPVHKKNLVPIAWIITLVWFFFGIGPGVVIGNWIFGNPNDPSTWLFGIPSIWTWQLLFWIVGIFMMWFLAVKMEMSTVTESQIEILEAERVRPATAAQR